MKTYTLDEAKDMHIGEIGSPERDAYERKVEKAKRKFLNRERHEERVSLKIWADP